MFTPNQDLTVRAHQNDLMRKAEHERRVQEALGDDVPTGSLLSPALNALGTALENAGTALQRAGSALRQPDTTPLPAPRRA